jgi:hypothetical protein
MIGAPAQAAPGGTVSASVTVEGACITVPTTPVDFGTLAFSSATVNTTATDAAFTVGNCSGQDQEYYARASDATDGLDTWALSYAGSGLICPTTDTYGAGLQYTTATTWLTTSDVLWVKATGPGSGPFSATPHIVMACLGSAGAGQTMNFSYTITAALP